MCTNRTEILNEVAGYYSEKIERHGDTPLGVDWNGKEGQVIRFQQLCKVIDTGRVGRLSLSDIGCGYGALLDYLTENYDLSSYLGIDVSAEMIEIAKARNAKMHASRFLLTSEPDVISDYSVASGIFNVRLGRKDAEWHDYMLDMLAILDRSSRFGFSFNCLTSYSDEDKKRGYLYYADPCYLFDLCKRKYSRQVALLHDYGLYEFTILVRKLP